MVPRGTDGAVLGGALHDIHSPVDIAAENDPSAVLGEDDHVVLLSATVFSAAANAASSSPRANSTMNNAW